MTTPFQLTREQRSRLFVASLDILHPDGPETGEYAFCETIAFSEFPGEVLELAREIDGWIYPFDGEYVDVDTSDLLTVHDQKTIGLAMRLAGLRQLDSGLYTTAPDGAPSVRRRVVSIPHNLMARSYV